jgi:hypothetical protein
MSIWRPDPNKKWWPNCRICDQQLPGVRKSNSGLCRVCYFTKFKVFPTPLAGDPHPNATSYFVVCSARFAPLASVAKLTFDWDNFVWCGRSEENIRLLIDGLVEIYGKQRVEIEHDVSSDNYTITVPSPLVETQEPPLPAGVCAHGIPAGSKAICLGCRRASRSRRVHASA